MLNISYMAPNASLIVKNAPKLPRLGFHPRPRSVQAYSDPDTHDVCGWEQNKMDMKFVSLLSCWDCLAVSHTLLEIIYFLRLQLSQIWIIEQSSENSDL